MFCCTLLNVYSSIAIILIGKRELVALLNLSSWCLVMVERLFLAVPWGCLRFVIVVFPDHTHLLFFLLYCHSPLKKPYLFNVAYNVTDNISSRAILRHNNYIFNRYLPVFISLAQPLFMRASARELLVPFLHLWYGAATGFEPTTSRSESGRSTN